MIGSPKMSISSNALHHAVKAGSVASVKFLMWTGANVNSQDYRKRTALHYACSCEDEDMQGLVDVLLEAGAEVNVQSLVGDTPLHMACRSMNSSAVVALLRHGAKIGLVNDLGRTPLHVVIRKAMKNRAAMSTFVALLTTITAEGFEGEDNLVCAVNLQDKNGDTALHLASALNNNEVVRSLIRLGAVVGVKSNAGTTALHWAARACAGNVVETLVHNGGDVNAIDTENNTPLHLACSRASVSWHTVFSGSLCKTIEELLCWGAKIYDKNFYFTPYEELYNEEDDFVYNEEEAMVIETTFIKHVIRVTTLNLEKEFDTSWILGPDFYEQVRTQCFQEFEDMKSSMLVKGISLFEVISHINQPFLLPTDHIWYICKVLCSPDLLKRFPLYGHMLRTTFQRPKLLTLAIKSFNTVQRKQMVKKLPREALEHLVTFLSNEDLKNLMKSE